MYYALLKNCLVQCLYELEWVEEAVECLKIFRERHPGHLKSQVWAVLLCIYFVYKLERNYSAECFLLPQTRRLIRYLVQ